VILIENRQVVGPREVAFKIVRRELNERLGEPKVERVLANASIYRLGAGIMTFC
jgi:hypothetical protein